MNKFSSTIIVITLALFVLVGVFAITRGNTPHASELTFVERSADAIGTVLPASCNSSPPTNHWAGDCPPAVGVTIGTNLNPSLTVTMTGITSTVLDSEGDPIAIPVSYTGGVWNVGSGGGMYRARTGGGLVSMPFTINYTSAGGAVNCWLRNETLAREYRGGASGGFDGFIGSFALNTYSLICSDGISFSPRRSFQVYGNWEPW